MTSGRLINRRLGAAAIGLLSLGGCANFSDNGGMEPVSTHVQRVLETDTHKIVSEEDANKIAERVDALLADPLTVEEAIQVALINNRGLQAQFNALGISEIEFVEAGILPNPTFSFERVSGGGAIEFERRIAGNLLGLFVLPARKDIAESHFKSAQYRTIDATLRLAADTRRAYYRAVAADMRVRFLERARMSAEATTDLMRRLGETGAGSKLDQARATGFYAEILAQVAAARLTARRERETLTRALGLWGDRANYELPPNLPDLPESVAEAENAEADAIRQRADLAAARLELEATSRAFGLTEATRFVSMLELAGISKTERGGGESTHSSGFEIALQIPIFDFGEISRRRGREIYMRAVNDLTEKAIAVRSETRTAYYAYRTAYDIARQYEDHILPARKIINDEVLLRYNGMLVDVFELLTTAHEGIASTIAAIEARRDFFIAEAEFKAALVGGVSSEAPSESPLASIME